MWSIKTSRGVEPDHVVIVHLSPVIELTTKLSFFIVVITILSLSSPFTITIVVTIISILERNVVAHIDIVNLSDLACKSVLLEHARSHDEVVEVALVGDGNAAHESRQANDL
mgnify:CR=1 FL=1